MLSLLSGVRFACYSSCKYPLHNTTVETKALRERRPPPTQNWSRS